VPVLKIKDILPPHLYPSEMCVGNIYEMVQNPSVHVLAIQTEQGVLRFLHLEKNTVSETIGPHKYISLGKLKIE